MKHAIGTWIGAAALALLGACDKGASAGGGAKSELVTKLEAQADAACACKDEACAEKVAADVQALASATKEVADGDLPALQAAQARIDGCLVKLNPRVTSYQKLTEQICACADKACGEGVATAVSKWASDLKASGKKLSQADAAAITESGKKAGACFQKLGLPIPQ